MERKFKYGYELADAIAKGLRKKTSDPEIWSTALAADLGMALDVITLFLDAEDKVDVAVAKAKAKALFEVLEFNLPEEE